MIDIALLATGAWTAIQPYLPIVGYEGSRGDSEESPGSR